MSHANEDVIREAYEAFGRADMESLMALWTDDVTWHDAGDHPLVGDHVGKEAVAAFLGGIFESTGGTFRAEFEHAVADDAGGFSLHRSIATDGDEEVSGDAVLRYRFENGKLAEIWTFDFDQRVKNRMLS